MSVVTEKVLEAAACRIALHVGCGDPSDFRDCNPKTCDCRAAASDALAAVAPIIAAQERERAAAMVETSIYIMSGSKPSHLEYDPKRAKNDNHHATIAAAIRAMKETT